MLGVIFLTILLSVMINFLFTMYHLYMRSKSEHQYRLLNVLYCHLALILQFGSVLNIINILRSLLDLQNDILNMMVEVTRTIQVLLGFLQSTLLGGYQILLLR